MITICFLTIISDVLSKIPTVFFRFLTKIILLILICYKRRVFGVYQENISGYTTFHTIGEYQMSGGVSKFTLNEFCSKIISTLTFCNNDIERQSDCVQCVTFVYRTHSGTIQNYLRELENVFHSSDVHGFQCVITGNFNFNLCSDSNDVHRFIEYMNLYHFIPIITEPTRFSSCESSSTSLSITCGSIKLLCANQELSFTILLITSQLFLTFLKYIKQNQIKILKPKVLFVIIVRLIGTALALHCN